MSLGRPDLYIAGQKMQTAKTDPRPALAGLSLKWGNDSRQDRDPAATLTGQLLIRGTIPAYLNVGAPVGLVDPATSRTLFAGHLNPLTASPEPSVAGAFRVSFTAASPLAELEQHTVVNVEYPQDETAAARRNRIAAALPAGWTLDGLNGNTWQLQGQQRYQSIRWLDLADRYARGYFYRISDTSTYIPGAGVQKRLTITQDRHKDVGLPGDYAGALGLWKPGGSISGTAILPLAAVARDMDWEKTPADVVTAVQVTTWGMWLVGTKAEDDSFEHEWPLDYALDTSALQRQHGFHLARIETSLSAQNAAISKNTVQGLTEEWLDTETNWRPTTLQIPDSRRLAAAPLLNLLAADTRHMAAVSVPQTTGLPARIRAFVLGGSATWTGKHWNTHLTLGRTEK